MRLYDCALRKKVDVVIDDNIPCHRGSREPLYAQHKGNEMYILLLEKAFAKFAGGYANLVGGYSVVAWMALTGCEEQQYWERSDDGKSWAKSLMEMDSRRERPTTRPTSIRAARDARSGCPRSGPIRQPRWRFARPTD